LKATEKTDVKKILVALLLVVLLEFPASAEHLIYHDIQTDTAGHIIPWYSPDLGKSYDHIIGLVWNFWKGMGPCANGVKYYLQHQVWKPEHDQRGLGGDQLAMALSSWNLLYGYSGDRSVLDDMVLIADYYIAHGFSKPTCAWPNLPYPYNTDVHSGVYDGDMRAGKEYLQPDKAGSFGSELLVLYKITGTSRYLDSAIGIANTLANKVVPGDNDHSPLPFRVHAETGKCPTSVSALYTSNWTGTLRLFDDLIKLNMGDVSGYKGARDVLSTWLKNYPMKTNKWGPFFEDVSEWSNTQINADTLAWYILEHPEWDRDWREHARAILDWTLATFGNNSWSKYGVTAINEQSAYMVPGNSHTSRHASVELLYCEKTGDMTRKANAIRQLNWATYMVDVDGKNRYPRDDIWLTDGYGDYIRHYLRSMGAAAELAPQGQNHLLRTTSVIKEIHYAANSVAYTTFDNGSREKLRMGFEPSAVTAGGVVLERLPRVSDLDHRQGYTFEAPGDVPGVLRVRHDDAANVVISRAGERQATSP
jgi:hypothetical protein